MKLMNKTWLLLLVLPCTMSNAEQDDPAKLAALTAKNVAMVSSALAAHQKGVNEIAATRAAHIVSINRLSINARQSVDRELSILKQTDGTDIVKLFTALGEQGDTAALASAQADAAEAAAQADVAAAYTPLAIATGKLDNAAKTLAAMAKEQSTEERLKFLLQFAKDVRDESAKLAKESSDKKASADKKFNATVEAATPPASTPGK